MLRHPNAFKDTLHEEVTIHLDSELPEYRLTMIELAWVFRASLNATDALARLLCNISNNDEYAEESIGLAYRLLKNDPKVLVEYLKIATPVDAQKHDERIRGIETNGPTKFGAHFKTLNDNVEALIAGMPHAGICEGAVGQPAVLP